MKSVKVIFISAEIAALLGLIMLVFLTNWQSGVEELILVKIMIVLLAIFAVVCQKEQGEIEWEEEDEEIIVG